MAAVPRVVIVGAGFAGLQCARRLAGEPVDVTLIDRQNYHLFTPLLYQVASCLLAPSEITAPLRKVFRRAGNVRVRVGEVTGVDFDGRAVLLSDGARVDYDHLVLAAGSTTNFFGNASIAKHALGLKDLGEALALRNHVLESLEHAAIEADERSRAVLTTFCIIGGGPTGVEFAGALAELARLVVPREYPELRSSPLRIVLLELGDRVLPSFHPSLSAYARGELARIGVDVRVGVTVDTADDRGVVLRDGTRIDAATVVWAAGVRPADLAGELAVARTARGRIAVDDRLRVIGHDGVYAIGDAAAAHDRAHGELPMVSPPAMQAGRHVADEILGRAPRPFRYLDKGNLATIGRRSAVAEIRRVRCTGLFGWLVWLVVHLYDLIGFENRLVVMLRWSWYYVRFERPVRAIIRADPRLGMRCSRAHCAREQRTTWVPRRCHCGPGLVAPAEGGPAGRRPGPRASVTPEPSRVSVAAALRPRPTRRRDRRGCRAPAGAPSAGGRAGACARAPCRGGTARHPTRPTAHAVRARPRGTRSGPHSRGRTTWPG